jgi:hypothetical protein
MYKKSLKIFVLLMLVGVIFFPASSHAFKMVTRDQLIYDAIEFSPAGLQAYLRDNIAVVAAGNRFAERHQRRSYSVDPYATEAIYKQLVIDLKRNRMDQFNTVHAFGVIACFIAETISPDNYVTAQHLIPYDVVYDGHQEIGDVKSHITTLIENYRIPGRKRMDPEVTALLYNAAVNEIVDYWVSAWVSSGHQAGQFAGAGETINHRIIVVTSKSDEEAKQ